ncbi:hypothetical protein P261_00817 [Lachnospiraceae bacterium TWA4]|nr:hypothetical protein P261_00817 [Lachnospiraceae bacterium TWA4]
MDLSGIDILTTFHSGNLYDREYILKFSYDSQDMLENQFKDYLNQKLEDNYTIDWENEEDFITCKIELLNTGYKEQANLLTKLFSSEKSMIYVSKMSERETENFTFGMKWSESIDLKSLTTSKDETIPFAYFIRWDDEYSIKPTRPNEKGDYQMQESSKYEGYKLVSSGQVKEWSVECDINHTYHIESIDVVTTFIDFTEVTRDISFKFASSLSESEQKEIKSRMDALIELCNGRASLQMENGEGFLVQLRGTKEQLNEDFETIFKEEGKLESRETGDFRDWSHDCVYTDQLSFKKFLTGSTTSTVLNYKLQLPSKNKIYEDSISSTANVKEGSQEIDGSVYSCSVNGLDIHLTLKAEKTNVNLLMILGGLFLFY